MQKAQYGILRFAKYKGPEIATSKRITNAQKKNTRAIPMWTLLAASTTFTWLSHRANIEQSLKNRSQRRAARPERTVFVWSKCW